MGYETKHGVHPGRNYKVAVAVAQSIAKLFADNSEESVICNAFVELVNNVHYNERISSNKTQREKTNQYSAVYYREHTKPKQESKS